MSGHFRARGAAFASLAVAASLLLAADEDLPGAEQPAIRFASPQHLQTVIGPSRIELELTVPTGDSVEWVELRLDGKPLATLSRPPWQSSFDAGDGSKERTLEAVMLLRSGQSARTLVRTSRLRIDQVEQVELVNLYAIVLGPDSGYVSDLEAGDFAVFENGRPQRIERFSAERKPLRVAIVLDTSSTMSGGKGTKLRDAREAALEFLDVLEAGDEGMVVAFSDSVRIEQDLTSNEEELARAIREASAGGGTALYDAIWRSARKLEDFDGRRVLVLLSDGRDEAYDGLGPGSLHTLEESLDQALRSEVMIFAIGLGRNLDKKGALRFGALHGASNVDASLSLEAILRRFAERTGGRALISESPSRLRRAFQDVAADLRNQYSIAYQSNDETRDGSWRGIRVTIPREPRLEVLTRDGYYTSKESESPPVTR